jgi:outer membrane protein insertion porin family
MESICWSQKHSSRHIRKRIPSGSFFLIFLIFVAAGPGYSQTPISEFQFKKVADINIQADGPVDRQFLTDLIEITPNVDILTTSKIRKSIELLYETGNFTNILVDAKPVGERVSLTFILRLVYRFDFVHLNGNLGLGSGRIKKKIQLRKLEPFTPEKVLRGREDILAILHENGYYLARVMPDVLLHRASKRAEVTYTIEAGIPSSVNSLVFSGQPHFPRTVLLARMKTKPGRRFREPELTRDLDKVEELYDANGFLEHDIRLEKKDFVPPHRINLVIHIDAGRQLIIETGGYHISTTRLRDTVPIWADHSYNDDTLEEGKRNLIHYLQTQGYFDAQVNWEKNISAEKILIKYTFEPGTRYEVRDISIQGNTHLSASQIKTVMLTRETGFLGAQRLVTRTFEADIGRILGAYREHGFLFANVTKREIVRTPDGKIDIHLQVDEGPQVTVAEIRMKGNKIIQTQFFLEHFKLKIGEPISESKVKADSNYIVALYSDRGYPKIQLENKLLLSRDKTKALIEYRVTEGEQIFVDRIVLSGNYRTVRGVITENLLFHEDDPLSLRKIAASQSKLYSLEIFDRVDLEVPRPDNLQKRQNVVIKVTESKPYTISYGFGYQSFDKLRGVFAISDRNLFGTDRIAALQLRGGFKEGRALITYSDPHLFYHKFDSTFSGFAEKRSIRTTFAFRRYGVSLQTERRLSPDPSSLELGRAIPPITSLFLRYDFENIDTFGTPTLSPLDRRFLAIHISSVTGSFVRDARDNLIDPTSGTFFSNELQFATSVLGSGTDFLKDFSQFQYYFPVRRAVVATSLRLGLARGFRETVKLPLSQRFFAGGGRTIRGFGLDEAGPRDEFGNPLGGNALFILNIEYRFPVYGSFGAVVFFDWGSTFPLISDFQISGLRRAAGIGLRYKTPIGPLTLDWGYKLDRRFTPIRESPSAFFISVGHAF